MRGEGWSATEDHRRLLEFAAACVFGASAAAVALALFLAPPHVRFTLLGASALAVAFAVCGNIRLGLLWALVLTAPLGLCKRFFITPNMGGASALQIDASDLFLFPLAFLLLREFHYGVRRR